jgi:hypothetical protein
MTLSNRMLIELSRVVNIIFSLHFNLHYGLEQKLSISKWHYPEPMVYIALDLKGDYQKNNDSMLTFVSLKDFTAPGSQGPFLFTILYVPSS